MNGTLVKNELIFDFASGALGASKSIFASTYLFLNTKASNLNSTFESLLGDSLLENKDTPVSKLKYTDLMQRIKSSHEITNTIGEKHVDKIYNLTLHFFGIHLGKSVTQTQRLKIRYFWNFIFCHLNIVRVQY